MSVPSRVSVAALVVSVFTWGCGWAQSSSYGAVRPAQAIDEAPVTAACGPQPPRLARESVQVRTRSGVRRFDVEIAADDPSREYGLMCRPAMSDHHGMLFEFPQPAEQTFWMKNTYIALDIIYIGPDGRIVSISRNARPFDETPLPSREPATGVLEINGGLAARLGIQPGDRVDHPFFRSH